MRRTLLFLLIILAAALPTFYYLSQSYAVNEDALLMPLDDTYIHFQYARQMAEGHPYHYNTDDDTTSGATSLLYIPILAIGYLIGFKGLSLAIWAVLLGILLHIGGTYLVYGLLTYQPNTTTQQNDIILPLLFTLAYGVSGGFVWAAVSGMETMLFVFAVLLTLYTFQHEQYERAIAAATLAALVRPEGAVIALSTAVAVWWQYRIINKWILGLPFVAILIQPTLNYFLTGTPTASGTLAKSHLYNVTVPFSDRILDSLETWVQMWGQLSIGRSDVDGWYMIPLVTIPAMMAILLSVRTSLRQKTVSVGLLAAVWMIGLSSIIATLDTAFWHFKRYQLPIMALMFPLAGWLILRFKHQLGFGEEWTFRLYGVAVLSFALYTTGTFAVKYHDNVWVVNKQQLAMARWVDANLPADARVGVHDVGVMRYIGNRDTYDVVGLTTPDTALAWRQGAGTIYETMVTHPYRPDYFAIYPNVQSLPFLVEAGVLGEELARFEIDLPTNTVASATGLQVVTRADWATLENGNLPLQSSIENYLVGATEVQSINVADLKDEEQSGYEWHQTRQLDGFATDVRNLSYVACGECKVIDGTRRITGGESLPLPDNAAIVVLRVHAAEAAKLSVGCGESPTQTRVVPSIPGYWLDIAFWVEDNAQRFCIQTDNVYYPARYWIYSGTFIPDQSSQPAQATFSDPLVIDFTFSLLNFESQIRDSKLFLDLTFQSNGNLPSDGKIFVHLYNDVNESPIAQTDVYLGAGTLPPANWLSGVIADRITLSLEDVPAGTYTLAIGFYDPTTGSRYGVNSSSFQIDGGRLFLEDVTVE